MQERWADLEDDFAAPVPTGMQGRNQGDWIEVVRGRRFQRSKQQAEAKAQQRAPAPWEQHQ
eukprot:9120035-Alexandrium_andersonii.AAC.1